MARYKPVNTHLSKLLPVRFSEQILPGAFEYMLNWLVATRLPRVCSMPATAMTKPAPRPVTPCAAESGSAGLFAEINSSRSIERAPPKHMQFVCIASVSHIGVSPQTKGH